MPLVAIALLTYQQPFSMAAFLVWIFGSFGIVYCAWIACVAAGETRLNSLLYFGAMLGASAYMTLSSAAFIWRLQSALPTLEKAAATSKYEPATHPLRAGTFQIVKVERQSGRILIWLNDGTALVKSPSSPAKAHEAYSVVALSNDWWYMSED